MRHGAVSYNLKQAKIYKFKGVKKYSCDENFFEKIDNEYKSYWLGFIAADGNVMSKPSYTLHIGLESSDACHIEEFKKHINATNPVRHSLYKYNKYNDNRFLKLSRIDIYSQKIISDLNTHGIMPNKTKQLNWNDLTKNIPDELIRHFIRGYFDGDGCWRIRKNKLGFNIGSASEMYFLEGIQNWLCNTLELNKNKIYVRKDRFKVLTYGGHNQCKKIHALMYNNSNIRLERKFTTSNNVLLKIT